MTPTVDKLNSRHYKMLYAYVTEGLSNRDMANRFDMNEGYMPTIKNSPAWKKEEDALREEIYGSHKAKLGKRYLKLQDMGTKVVAALARSLLSSRCIDRLGQRERERLSR
jgi:isopenicillin N synthase-like dioxygenase